MNALRAIRDWLSANSQQLMNWFRSLMALLLGFKVIVLSDPQTQLALIYAVVEGTFQLITAKTTVHQSRIDTIVEKRVEDILTPPPAGRNP